MRHLPWELTDAGFTALYSFQFILTTSYVFLLFLNKSLDNDIGGVHTYRCNCYL
jgi:hypothetical protein